MYYVEILCMGFISDFHTINISLALIIVIYGWQLFCIIHLNTYFGGSFSRVKVKLISLIGFDPRHGMPSPLSVFLTPNS